MARRFYGEHSGGHSAIGRKVMLDVLNSKPQATAIVGVVGDTREMDLAQETEPQIYFPGFSAAGTVVLRASQDPLSLSAAIVHEVHAIDPMQPVARIEAMDAVVDASLGRRRFSLRLLAGFALLALFLACTGLYGVISYSVEQRTQELGLRQALGGKPSDLMLMILVEGLWLSAIGLAGGAVAAVAATRAMSNLLYQTSATDSLTFAVTGLILGVVSAISCLARRGGQRESIRWPRFERSERGVDHSSLSAMTGSTRAARSAGIAHADTATTVRITMVTI